jgi:aryl-alcohol dehydrogenase-like predicted oxidoreductase
LRALDDLVRAGRIRYIGSSGASGWQLVDMLWCAHDLGLNRPVVEQTAYHLLDRRAERDLMPAALTHDTALMVWSPLAGGLLTGKYLGQHAQLPRPRWPDGWSGTPQGGSWRSTPVHQMATARAGFLFRRSEEVVLDYRDVDGQKQVLHQI